MKFHWFLPTNGGDGRQVVGGGHGVEHGAAGRPANVPYLGQIARSAEQLGFEAALTPTGAWCEDAWLTTAMLAPLSERLKFLVAFRPGLTSPTLAAQMAATFQNLSGGRLLLNVVTGGESIEQRAYGDFLDKDGATAAATSSSRSSPGCGRGRRSPSTASSSRSRTRPCSRSPTRSPRSTSVVPRRPPATSPPSTPTSTSPGASRPRPWRRRSPGSASSPRSRAARSGSASACTPSTATPPRRRGREADRLLEGIDEAAIAQGPGGPARSPSRSVSATCSRSTRAARTTSRSTPTSGPASAWSAAARAPRWSAATSEVADRVEEYAALGIDEFVLSAYPHLEGAYHFGEGVLPDPGAARRLDSTRPPWPRPPSRSVRHRRGRRHDHHRHRRQPQGRLAHARRRDLPRRRARGSRPRDRPGRARRASSSTARRPTVARTRRAGVGQRPGDRRQPDLQGHLHRTAQVVPRLVPARTRCSAPPPCR